jgi:hypothetical protein
MRSVLIILAIAVAVSFAVVPDPEHILVRYDTGYTGLDNIITALNNESWPHTDFIGTNFAGFWAALNDGTEWDFVIMEDLNYRDVTIADYDQLPTYGTAHPDCRIIFADWYMQNYTSIWSFFDVNGCTGIGNTAIPAYVWDPDSPCFDGLTPPPVIVNPGSFGTIGHRLGWNAAKATSDVPLGWVSTSTAGQACWVFARLQGTEEWRRPRSLMQGFSMGFNPSNGVAYYQNILHYMWDEEETNPRVEATSLGNVKALYR